MSITINSKTPKAITIGGKAVKSLSINGDVVWQKDMNYFYIEDKSNAANSVTFTKTGDVEEWVSLEYSTDKSTWSSYTIGTAIPLEANGKVYLRGNNSRFSTSSGGEITYHSFSSTGNIHAGGDALSLLSDDITPISFGGSNARAFEDLFLNCTTLVSVDAGLFDSITLDDNSTSATYVFSETFRGCSNLGNVPDMSGVTLAPQQSLQNMFRDCTAITDASNLLQNLVRVTGNYSFSSMFNGCTSLVIPPNFNGITSTANCNGTFRAVFQGCSAMTVAPSFNSLTVVYDRTFANTFVGCSSLTTAPDLSGITSVYTQSFQNTYYNCSSLATVYTPNISTWDTSVFDSWLFGVANSGNLEVPNGALAALIPTNSSSGCPTGWTVANL